MGTDGTAKAITDGRNTKAKPVNILQIQADTEGNIAIIDGCAIVYIVVSGISISNDKDLIIKLAKHCHDGGDSPERWETVAKAYYEAHQDFVRSILLSLPIYLFDGRSVACKAATHDDRRNLRREQYDAAQELLNNGNTEEAVKRFRYSIFRSEEMTRVAIEICQSLQVYIYICYICFI